MFRQPTINGQKLKATSGRGDGTNYTAPNGERVKMSDKAVAFAKHHDHQSFPMGTAGEQIATPLRWIGNPPNKDERPVNEGIKTSGPTVKGRKGVL